MCFDNVNNNYKEIEEWQNNENSRLENIGYCNKISDCLRELNTQQGETRAIWELIQNARDMANNKPADIEITLSNESFIFSHHGMPFDYTSLRSLVKQDSSKDRTDAELAGKFGTGFMTTHIFNKVVYITAPYEVKDNKQSFGYVKFEDFPLSREFVDDPIKGPQEMAKQLKKVSELAKQPLLKNLESDKTSFKYEVNLEKANVISSKLDSIINLLPFVLTINSNIQSVKVTDNIANRQIIVKKNDEHTEESFSYENWRYCKDCIEIVDERNNKTESYCCCSLQSKNSEDIVIIPPYPTNCNDLKKIPSLFLWFPLLGTENFGVNFIFHSSRFFPVETRDNIVLPNSSVALSNNQGKKNEEIINEMTDALIAYYGNKTNSRLLEREMCEITFPDNCNNDEMNRFYTSLRKKWIKALPYWEIIPIGNEKKSISDSSVRLLHEDFFKQLNEEQKNKYSDVLKEYASFVLNSDGLHYDIPASNDLIAWSETVSNWKCEENSEDFFITIDNVCSCIKSKNDNLVNFLNVLIECNGRDILDRFKLLPNRDGKLCYFKDLSSAKFSNDVYEVVKGLMTEADRNKIIDIDFSNINGLYFGDYSFVELYRSINSTILEWKKESIENKKDLSDEQIEVLISFCSGSSNLDNFKTTNRGRMMEILPLYYERQFKFVQISVDYDESAFYRSAYDFLIEYTSYQIGKKNSDWVKDNHDWLLRYLKALQANTSQERAKLLDQYKLIPNQLNELCTKNELEINNSVPPEMNIMYISIFGEENNLAKKWINEDFIQTLVTDKSVISFKETDPEAIALKIQDVLCGKMKEDPEPKYKELVQDIIDKICDDSHGALWKNWFKVIDGKKEEYTFSLITDSSVRKSLFSFMKWNPQYLESLNNIESSTRDKLFSLLDNEKFVTILDEVAKQIEQEQEEKAKLQHRKIIGEYIENKLKEKIGSEISATVDDIQNGQDIIVSVNGHEIYYIEVKSKWDFKEPAHMSNNQIKKAVNNKDKYALFCVDLRSLSNKKMDLDSLSEDVIVKNTKVKDDIGYTLSSLMENIIDADYKAENDEGKITINWYQNNIKAKSFTEGKTIDEFLIKLEQNIRNIK